MVISNLDSASFMMQAYVAKTTANYMHFDVQDVRASPRVPNIFTPNNLILGPNILGTEIICLSNSGPKFDPKILKYAT